MLMVVWVSFVSTFYSGNAENQLTRHERTRYVSSRNQIYGGNFDYNEKYIPFVHYWERPLQVLESSMKIPKKLSSRPLFSWDLPVQITSYSPSKKILATENSVTEKSKILQTPETVIPILKSRSGRAKPLGKYPESFGFIPTKKKKSTNRKKSVESVKLKEFTAEKPTSVKRGPDGKIKRKKKGKKSRKSKKSGKHLEKAKQTNEVKVPENVAGERMTFVKDKPEVRPPCEAMEKKCEHRCKEVKGKAMCVCFRGFTAVGNKCQDVNECETNNGGCNGKCHNTMGSRKCICNSGFRLVDGACADINECLLRNGHGPCQDKCVNTLGSYYCTCDGLPGTELSSDKHTCEKNNECNLSSAGCSHSCISVSGRAYCTCPDGMELGDDWKTCHDIDECSNPEDYNVDCSLGCINTVGSYICVTGNGTLNYLEK